MAKKKKVTAFEEVGKKNQIFDYKNFLEISAMDDTKFFCL